MAGPEITKLKNIIREKALPPGVEPPLEGRGRDHIVVSSNPERRTSNELSRLLVKRDRSAQ